MSTKAVKLWLTLATTEALQTEARRQGRKYSEVAEELLAAGLTAHVAGRLEEQALPVFTAAVQQVVAEQLRRQERRLVAALAPVGRDAGLAARVAYAHLYRDHPSVAEADWQEASDQIEAVLRDGGLTAPTDGPVRRAGG